MKTSTNKIKSFFFLVASSAILLITNCAKAQLTVDTTYTPQQLVQDVLLGQGVTASNITCNCVLGAYAYFNGNSSNIGLPGGVLLTTGQASIAIGPNNDDAAGVDNGVMYIDSQLISIDPNAYFDPCILEFDFVPDSSYIEFKYVFGSEEYNEYVATQYNDAFGFFLTGPGITNANNNIALVPSTTVPIAINNVNNGYAPSFTASAGPCSYCQYYYDNLNGLTIQYDGFTTVLTAQANVMKDSTYHIKLAIADASDGVYDSGVFLKCGSFSSSKGGQTTCNIILSAAEKELNNQLTIYPNPVADVLTLSFSSFHSGGVGGEAIVSDITGRQLYKQSLVPVSSASASNAVISTKSFSNGIYLLQVREGNEIVNRKFIVAH